MGADQAGGLEHRRGKLRQVPQCALFRIVPVQPVELVNIEHGRALGNVIERELLDQLLRAQDFRFPIRGRPSQQRQVVPQRLGQNPHFAEALHGSRPVALGEPRAVGPQDGGEVCELRGGPAEGAIEGQLPRRVGNVVVAADHVGNFHKVVVNHHRVIVGGQALRAHQDGIADDLAGNGSGAVYAVVPKETALDDLQAHGRRFAGGPAAHGLLRRKFPAAPRVARLAAASERLLPLSLQLLRRAKAIVGIAVGDQLLRVLDINRGALRLAVRCKRPARVRTFVPVEPEPAQVFEQLPLVFRRRTLRVRILDAQDEDPAVMARKQPIEKGRPCYEIIKRCHLFYEKITE